MVEPGNWIGGQVSQEIVRLGTLSLGPRSFYPGLLGGCL